MKFPFKIALFSLAFHAVSLAISFDTALLVLAIIFVGFAVISLLSKNSQTVNVIWLFSGLIMVAYTIFYAYTTIPGTAFDPVNILVSVLKLVGALTGIIANTFALELNNE